MIAAGHAAAALVYMTLGMMVGYVGLVIAAECTETKRNGSK